MGQSDNAICQQVFDYQKGKTSNFDKMLKE